MPTRRLTRTLGLALLIALGATSPAVQAQAGLPVLRASPFSSVTQTVGFTEATVRFHRPGVKGRDIFGSLVPYGQMWRVGANENTTISFTSPVSINDQPLDAGTYGLHVIPFREKPWTVIFSTQTNLWGAFGYDKSKDALRLEITPVTGGHVERMNFEFSPIDDTTCTMFLRWADISLKLDLEVDLDASRFAATRVLIEEKGANDPALLLSAAQWAVENPAALDGSGGLEVALGWIEQAVAQNKTFTNLGVQAQLLEMLGRPEEAAPLKKEAWMVATEEDLSRVGGQLMSNRQYAAAIPIYKLSVRNSPKSWKAYDQLAEAYRKSGDEAAALEAYTKALDLSEEEGTRERIKKTVAELESSTRKG